MRVFAALVLLLPVFAGQVVPPAATIELATPYEGICDFFPYLPGCPR
ncbi:MAG TPA: hypothetical protein PKV13_01695 [Propionicimonas sp.]|nr:hypothetical protein [Propionicimonas sp.]HRA05319.1 hypothetical protein [Propionicimonas sp.]